MLRAPAPRDWGKQTNINLKPGKHSEFQDTLSYMTLPQPHLKNIVQLKTLLFLYMIFPRLFDLLLKADTSQDRLRAWVVFVNNASP